MKKYIQQIEIGFWHLVIPLMQNSRIVRFLVPYVHSYLKQEFSKPALIATSGSVFAGLVLGYFLGMLSNLL